MSRYAVIPAVLLMIAGCASPPSGSVKVQNNSAMLTAQPAGQLAPFSAAPSGGLPPGWIPMVIFKNKQQTRYQLVTEQKKTVLHAYSANASSGLMHPVDIDPEVLPWLHWQWKIGRLAGKAAQSHGDIKNIPVRIILGFDGDKESLPFSEQILFDTAKVMTGHDFPYATLMYEWDSREKAETIKYSKRSSRIRTMVVESGSEHVGNWRSFSRNIVADFEKMYGEKPGRLIGVGVLTESNGSGAAMESWYGDIRLLPFRQ